MSADQAEQAARSGFNGDGVRITKAEKDGRPIIGIAWLDGGRQYGFWIELDLESAGDERTVIAHACHEVNRAYCAKMLNDASQLPWAAAPEWQRQSAINGVVHALNHPRAKPEDSHESWLAEKREQGWKYGPVKNPEAKEHPCFLPYDQLPTEQKRKDAIFLAVVRALAPS